MDENEDTTATSAAPTGSHQCIAPNMQGPSTSSSSTNRTASLSPLTVSTAGASSLGIPAATTTTSPSTEAQPQARVLPLDPAGASALGAALEKGQPISFMVNGQLQEVKLISAEEASKLLVSPLQHSPLGRQPNAAVTSTTASTSSITSSFIGQSQPSQSPDGTSTDLKSTNPDYVNYLLNTHGVDIKQNINLEDLRTFAAAFRKRRIELGFSQLDVGRAMGRLYNEGYSQCTIARFEVLALNFKNMCDLMHRLGKWLHDAESIMCEEAKGNESDEQGTDPPAKKKRRTTVNLNTKVILETCFRGNPTPTAGDIVLIADYLNMEKEDIRVWYCNRREREKQLNGPKALVNLTREAFEAKIPQSPLTPSTGLSTIDEEAGGGDYDDNKNDDNAKDGINVGNHDNIDYGNFEDDDEDDEDDYDNEDQYYDKPEVVIETE